MKYVLPIFIYLFLSTDLSGQAIIPNELLDTLYYSQGHGFLYEHVNLKYNDFHSTELIGYSLEKSYNNKVHLVKVFYLNSVKPLAEYEAYDTLIKNPVNEIIITENEFIPEYSNSVHKEGAYTEWYENGQKKIVCNYKNNKLHGDFTKYYPNGAIKRKDTWKWGFWANGTCYDRDGSEIDYVPYKEDPEYIGGNEALTDYLQNNIVYPTKAFRQNIQGKVYAKFAIDHDGSVINIEIIKGVHEVIDQEALRVLKMMPRWKPGTIEGETVRVYYTLPLNFMFR